MSVHSLLSALGGLGGLREPQIRRAPALVPTLVAARPADLAMLAETDFLHRPGAYIAVRLPQTLDHRPEVLCGEGEHVGTRALQKLSGHKEPFDAVLLFSCEQAGFTKRHAEDLERRLTAGIEWAGRARLLIGQAPKRRRLAPGDTEALDAYERLARAELLALGIGLLEPEAVSPTCRSTETAPDLHRTEMRVSVHSPEPKRSSPLALMEAEAVAIAPDDPVGSRYGLAYRDLEAEIVKTDERGVKVLKGSEASAQVARSLPAYVGRRRAALVASGVLVQQGDRLVFARDVVLDSPSLAAKIVTGSPQGAGSVWRRLPGDVFQPSG